MGNSHDAFASTTYFKIQLKMGFRCCVELNFMQFLAITWTLGDFREFYNCYPFFYSSAIRFQLTHAIIWWI